MSPGEARIVAVVETLMQEHKRDEIVTLLEPRIEEILTGARSRHFTGAVFDAYCRALLSRGHGPDVRAAVAHLCERSRVQLGDQPWTFLYEGALLHLDGDDEAAAERYALAAADAGVLWTSSIGCRSVVGPRRRDELVASTPHIPEMRHEKRAEAADFVFFVACDRGYLRYASTFVKSVARHGGASALHLHIVNPEPDDLAWVERQAGEIWPRTAVTTETYHGPDERAYFALARLIRIAEIVESYGQPVLMTDVDAAFTAPVRPPLAAQNREDVALHFKGDDGRYHPWNTVQGGSTLVWPTERGRAFAATLSALAAALFAERAGRGVWFIDQNVLFSTYRKFAHEPGWTIGDLSGDRLPGGLRHGKNLDAVLKATGS